MNSTFSSHTVPNTWKYLSLAALIMAFGWGYRGTVGHEGGAMIPGALLGLVLALGSGRLDFQRRSLVFGLFGAAGFAWGGSLSYMEQTFYILSDSFPDVLYGYAMLFFLGGMWAGIAGAVLGLAVTAPRSELEKLARVFTLICSMYLIVYLYLFFNPEQNEAVETLTVRHFHDGDWLPALLALVGSYLYWILKPRDRSASILFVKASLAWAVGYLVLTKFGGLRLGPLHRSESWGGVLGILAVLLWHLRGQNNRAAELLCRYGILGGGLGFAAAVFLRHPIMVDWGPFKGIGGLPNWRLAEDLFGLFMGVALGLGMLRLLKGGLASPSEDRDRKNLDVFAAFAILVALVWVNFRRHAAPALREFGDQSWLGIPLWLWYVILGVFPTMGVLYALVRYHRGDRSLVPASAFGKGAMVALALTWIAIAGHSVHDTPGVNPVSGHLILWGPAGLATLLLVSFGGATGSLPVRAGEGGIGPSDPHWRVGPGFWGLAAAAPFFLVALTWLSMGMQEDGSIGRKRFGPEAYWRQTSRLQGTWKAVSIAPSLSERGEKEGILPIEEMRFSPYRDVTVTLPEDQTIDAHRWFLKNQFTWLDWYSKEPENAQRAEVPLHFQEDLLYIPWPPHNETQGYLVLEKVEED